MNESPWDSLAGGMVLMRDELQNMIQEKSKFTWSEDPSESDMVTVNFEGEDCMVPAGTTVAAALLGHDDNHFCRSAAEGEKRAPYCLMGICFECLVEIDGVKNRQACLEPIVEGMRIKRQYPESKENNK